MSSYVVTLKNADKTNELLPRTVIEAISDKNNDTLSNDLVADDINVLKNGAFAALGFSVVDGAINVTYTE